VNPPTTTSRRSDGRAVTVTDGRLHPIGDQNSTDRWCADIEIAGLPGWQIEVDIQRRPADTRIVRLLLVASDEGAVLSGEDVRCISPRAIIHAVEDEWLLEGAGVREPPEPGKRTPRTDDYLRALTTELLRVQDEPGSSRRALAARFGRSESQIRDDLRRAEHLGFLAPTAHGSRRRDPGRALAPP
jgi:hypothetical protein